ncbi:hypothetical protein Tco_1387998 [Tanacetum coccineum]
MNKFVLASFSSFIVNIESVIPMKVRVSLPIDEDLISWHMVSVTPSNLKCQVRRICHEEEIDVLEYQVLTREIEPTLKPLEEIIWENVFCLGGNRDHSYVLYDRVMNPLAAQQEPKPRKDRGTRRGLVLNASSSAFDQPSSSHLNDDDDDGNGEGTSCASTLSPIRYTSTKGGFGYTKKV